MRISRRRYKPQPQQLRFRSNEGILAPEVRVLDADGTHVGTMTREAALALAREKELDLVEINPKVIPPVVKITEYGQYKYQKEKEERLKKARTKATEVKGVRLSLRISEHDLDLRAAAAQKFFSEGHKVKVEIILRGRERAYGEHANGVIEKFIQKLRRQVRVFIEQPIARQANKITALLAARPATAADETESREDIEVDRGA